MLLLMIFWLVGCHLAPIEIGSECLTVLSIIAPPITIIHINLSFLYRRVTSFLTNNYIQNEEIINLDTEIENCPTKF